MHRHLFEILSLNPEYVKELIAMIEIIIFILHVEVGIYRIIHNVDISNYIYLNMKSNIIIFLLVQVF